VLAIDAGLLSRRKAVEATGYDIEEIDRPPPQSFLRHRRRPIEPGWRCLDG